MGCGRKTTGSSSRSRPSSQLSPFLLIVIMALSLTVILQKRNEIKNGPEHGEIAELVNRVKCCEASVGRLRVQLTEKDDDINDLQNKLFEEKRNLAQTQRELDQTAVKLKAAHVHIDALKAELQLKDDKVCKLLNELRESLGLALTISDLESQLDSAKLRILELSSERDELKKCWDADKEAVISRLTEELRVLKAENESLKVI